MAPNLMLTTVLAGALLALHVGVAAAGGISASCTDSTNWVAHSDKANDGTTTPLSGCQESILGVTHESDIASKYKIGGKGSADIIGITAGAKAGGCTSVTDCMQECQPLCCLASGCTYAQIWQDKKSDDYVVYSKTSYKWYCELYSAATYKKSDTCTVCQASSTANCASIVSDQLSLNSTYYAYLKAVSDTTKFSTCPSTTGRRSLLSSSGDAATATASRAILADRSVATASTAGRQLLQSAPPVLPANLKLWAAEAIDDAVSLKDLTLGEIEAAMKKAAAGHSFLAYVESRLNKKCAAIAKTKPCPHMGHTYA